MFINDVVGPYIGVFIEWGFLMVFLLNWVLYINNPNKSIVILSFIMAVSYITSELLYLVYSIYLNWFIYDLLTLTCIGLLIRYQKISPSPVNCYIMCGLILNAILIAAIYCDIYVRLNSEPWWLWSVYSFGVNICDVIMITALAINKDFLGLSKLLQKARIIKGLNKNQALVSKT